MGFVGDTMRNVAQKIDPEPSKIMVAITQDGKDRAKQLAAGGMGGTQVGLILSHLDEYSPQSVSEIANACQLHWQIVKRTIMANQTYFQVRM